MVLVSSVREVTLFKTVLGIENRTENWMAAHKFAPLFDNPKTCLDFANRLTGANEQDSGLARIELFWKGMRDFLHSEEGKHITDSELSRIYGCLFPDLRCRVQEYSNGEQSGDGFRSLQDVNYVVSTKESKTKLFNNLRNTEIDIVIETPDYLLIGEAKHETDFHANGSLVLVHQLIRQYVMVRILLRCLGRDEKRVVLFVVGDCAEKLKRKHQVKFMIQQRWLKKSNVIEWRDIGNFHPER